MVVFVRKMWNYERRVPLTGAAAIRTWREQRPCSTDHTSTHNRTNDPLINEINFRINLSWKLMFRLMLLNWTEYVMYTSIKIFILICNSVSIDMGNQITTLGWRFSLDEKAVDGPKLAPKVTKRSEKASGHTTGSMFWQYRQIYGIALDTDGTAPWYLTQKRDLCPAVDRYGLNRMTIYLFNLSCTIKTNLMSYGIFYQSTIGLAEIYCRFLWLGKEKIGWCHI